MLRSILDANDGLPEGVHVTFQNTGKEREETLEFVQACSENWGVPIKWLEWVAFVPPGRSKSIFRVVDFATASRAGEPFDALTTALGYLPNPTQRLCTAYLKVKTGEAFMRSLGYDEWINVMGIRSDEPARIARLRSPGRDNSGGDPVLPLAECGVTKRIVGDFWKRQPFDLNLQNIDGVTPEGNCDLCFLKSVNSVYSQVRREPSRAVWWAGQEIKVAEIRKDPGGASLFRSDRPSYSAMLEMAQHQADFFGYDEDIVDCMCGEGV